MDSYVPFLTRRFDLALQFASGLHHHQARKGGTIPYIAHLMSVCALVLPPCAEKGVQDLDLNQGWRGALAPFERLRLRKGKHMDRGVFVDGARLRHRLHKISVVNPPSI